MKGSSWTNGLEPHTWLVDQDGIIYDLTGVQFNPGLTEPSLPLGVVRVGLDDPLYFRHEEFDWWDEHVRFRDRCREKLSL